MDMSSISLVKNSQSSGGNSESSLGNLKSSLNSKSSVNSEIKQSQPHIERTQSQERSDLLYRMRIGEIKRVNEGVRIVRLFAVDAAAADSSYKEYVGGGEGLQEGKDGRKGEVLGKGGNGDDVWEWKEEMQIGIPTFKPGQWIDLHIPCKDVRSPGGFTITSSPRSVRGGKEVGERIWREGGEGVADVKGNVKEEGYLELAIQKSDNPPVEWLCQREEEILGKEVGVRVGGGFVWPPSFGPPSFGPPSSEGNERVEGEGQERNIQKVVFIAGGVGINPLMSMLRYLYEDCVVDGGLVGKGNGDGEEMDVKLLYTFKPPKEGEVLYLTELVEMFRVCAGMGRKWELGVFVTGNRDVAGGDGEGKRGVGIEGIEGIEGVEIKKKRIEKVDIEKAIGEIKDKERQVVYVCGPRGMTDEFVGLIAGMEGMGEEKVLCERWW